MSPSAPRSCTLAVHVTPGAREDAVRWDEARGWRVHVAATATDNRANDRLRAFLAREVLGIPTAEVTVKTGATGRQKVLAIALDAATVDAALHAWASRDAAAGKPPRKRP